jgi:hypothetical protein
MGCWPCYYVGLRHELEGRPDDARRAYEQAVDASRAPNPHLTSSWARYRLRQLTAQTPAAAPSTAPAS